MWSLQRWYIDEGTLTPAEGVVIFYIVTNVKVFKLLGMVQI